MLQCHHILDVSILRKLESTLSLEEKPHLLVSSFKTVDKTPAFEDISKDYFDPKFDVKEEYRPFVSVGSVFLVVSVFTSEPISILRDIGTALTLISKNIISKNTLPFGKSFANGEFVVVQCVGCELRRVMLHRINLVLGIVLESVVVDVIIILPVKSVPVLL